MAAQVVPLPGAGVQIHDFSPGISEAGLFWTVPVHPETVAFTEDLSTVSFRVPSMGTVDAFNLPNALAEGPTVPATVSFEVVWTASGPTRSLESEAHDFAGDFRPATAAVAWTGSSERGHYQSDPPETSETIYALVGRERNGAFRT